MGWFDNTEPQSFDASQSFNYGSEQDKIKRGAEGAEKEGGGGAEDVEPAARALAWLNMSEEGKPSRKV